MATIREVKQSPTKQGVAEEIVYTLNTLPWGGSPTSSSAEVFDVTNGGRRDVTLTVMPSGSSSEAGDIVTCPVLKDLTLGRKYRLEIKFTTGGQVEQAFGKIDAEQ